MRLNDGKPKHGNKFALYDGGSNLGSPVFGWQNNSVVQPVASFSVSPDPATGNSPLTIAFTDTSTNIPTSWLWVITGGTLGVDYVFTVGSATSQNPTIRFDIPGSYSVVLTATNAAGSDDSDAANITANFTPSIYATVLAWLKNATGMTAAQWSDQSGNNNHAAQSSATKRPTLNPIGMNSLPTLDFDGVDDFLSFGVALGKPAYFCEVIVYTVVDITRTNRISGAYDGVSIGTASGGQQISNGNEGKVQSYNSDGVFLSHSTTDDVLITNNIPVIVSVKYSTGVSRKIFDRGVSVPVTDGLTSANSNEGSPNNYSLGRLGDLDGDYHKGKIAEYIMFGGSSLSDLPSDADILIIANYYKTKFNIS